METFVKLKGQESQLQRWELTGLAPAPEEAWRQMKEFLGLGPADFRAMVETVEPLLKRGHELVVGNYDYLLKHRETAEILGWEQGADPEHLAERRRFFAIWLARTLGLDLSDDFARYLFKAGQIHAGHGPRQIHVPELYVTGAISLVNATFARFLAEEMPAAPVVPLALAGWNKLLSLHLHLMLLGYQAARALDQGDFRLKISLFGRMRSLTGRQTVEMALPEGARLELALKKFFDYFPQARPEVFQTTWEGGEHLDANGTPWFTAERVYMVNPMWRVLLNGRDLSYIGGPQVNVSIGDEISIFPPGR